MLLLANPDPVNGVALAELYQRAHKVDIRPRNFGYSKLDKLLVEKSAALGLAVAIRSIRQVDVSREIVLMTINSSTPQPKLDPALRKLQRVVCFWIHVMKTKFSVSRFWRSWSEYETILHNSKLIFDLVSV